MRGCQFSGATEYAEGKADTISGIKTNDNTGDITIELTEPNGTFDNVLGLMFAAPVPAHAGTQLRFRGADDGNRTRVFSLGSCFG
jgi:hypothetical protein